MMKKASAAWFREYLYDFDLYEVVTACDGEEALGILAEKEVSLSIVDLRLPGMNGSEFIRQASAANLCKFFIIHTGSNDMKLTGEMKELGMTVEDIFFKPADLDLIMERIQQLLESEK